jgi:hypothetical protein
LKRLHIGEVTLLREYVPQPVFKNKCQQCWELKMWKMVFSDYAFIEGMGLLVEIDNNQWLPGSIC